MLKKLILAVAVGITAVSAFAGDYEARAETKQAIGLKDGSTVYIFKDGKMAMEDKLGRSVNMKEGTVMEATDGQKVIMHGDEVMRLDELLHTAEDAG